MTESMRVGDVVTRNAERSPSGPALFFEGSVLTWSDLNTKVNRLASGLAAMGVRRGQRVAAIMRNGPTAVEFLFAAGKAGLIGVPINYGLTDSEIDVLIKDSDPHCLIVAKEFATRLAKQLRSRDSVVVIAGGGEAGVEAPWLSLEEVLARGEDDFDDPAVKADDIRNIRYTSGTTATPKGLLSTHRQIFSSIKNFFDTIDVPSSGPFFQLLPLSSGAGIWMQVAVAYQGVPSALQPSFSPSGALSGIEEVRAAHAYCVPTIVSRLTDAYESGSYDLSSLKLLGYGGSPMPLATIRRALTTLPSEMYHGFGGGEMGGLVSYLLPEQHREAMADPTLAERLRSVGRPSRYATIRIRDARERIVGAGEIGEITVKSPSNFSGYWRRDVETSETLRGEWVFTGDLGFFDGDGFLYAVDRKKDMVLTGGMNVSSAEVEAVLVEHPDVSEAAVIGVPDEEWGEVVTAVVVTRPGRQPDKRAIMEFCRARLAGYKTPKSVEYVDALPMNSAGKVLKRTLRERFKAATEAN